jgi:hypothetical protein
MPINPNIPLQAANIPQIRYQPESQFESFAKIQPTLNAMQQMRTQAMESQEKMAQRQALQKMRQDLMAAGKSGDLGMYAQALIGSGDTRLMELGAKISQSLMEEQAAEQSLAPFRGQPVTRESVQNMLRAGGAAARAGEQLRQTLPTTPAEVETARAFGFQQTPEGYSAMKGAGRAEAQGPEIVQLMRARDALPAGSPDRALVQARIDKLNAPSSGVTVEMPVAVYNEKTGQTTYVPRQQAIGMTPASAAPKPVDTTQSEEQAATNTARLLRRSREIAAALQRNPSAEAPSALEASIQNIPVLSAATNLVRNTDRQIVASAQDDILDALLYLATGAAYNKEQLQQQKSAYLASWSDSAETRAIKRQRLTDMVRDAKIRAGNAWTPELDSQLNLLLESPVMQSQANRGSVPAPAPAPAPARTGGVRREIAPGVFVTERP